MNLNEMIEEQELIISLAKVNGNLEIMQKGISLLTKLQKIKENRLNKENDKIYLVEIYHPNYSIDRVYRKEKETALELFKEKIKEMKNKYKVSNIEKQYIFEFEKEEKNEKPLKKLVFTVLEEMQYAYGEEREEHLHLDLKEIEVL